MQTQFSQAYGLPRAPSTCCWGGLSVLPRVFPPCRHPVLAAKLRPPRDGHCQHCPYFEEWDPADAIAQRSA